MNPDTTLPKEPKIKEWHGILSQSGTSNPTTVVLHNTLNETITWTRVSTGNYKGTPETQFNTNKTICITTPTINNLNVTIAIEAAQINIYTNTSNDNTPVDGVLTNTPIIIHIYE